MHWDNYEYNFEVLCDALQLAAVVLLPYKLHTSRSAAGVSLKMQELYLLVYCTRSLIYVEFPPEWGRSYNGVTAIAKIILTATTIGMMRCRPSLRASYDVSLDHFRSWAHAIFPAFALTMVIWASECWFAGEGFCWLGSLIVFLQVFSQVLEPFAMVPQLLVFRGCTDAGRLTGVYISLMGAYRALLIIFGATLFFTHQEDQEDFKVISDSDSLSPFITSSTTDGDGFLLLVIIVSTIQTVTLVVFLVDWRFRVYRRSPPEEIGDMDMMEPNSAARERLLPHQPGTGDRASANRFGIAGGGGAAADEASSPRRRPQGVDIVDRIEGVLLRERGEGQPSSPYGPAATAPATRPEVGVRGRSGEVHLV